MNESNGTDGFLCGYEPGSPPYALTCVAIAVGLPLSLTSIYAVFSLVQKDNVAPLYVVNLLFCDVIQLCSMTMWVIDGVTEDTCWITDYVYYFSVMAGVGFMVCVSLERYLVIAWPLWYRFRRTIKASAMVCVLVWLLPLLYVLPWYFDVAFTVVETIYAVFLLLPFPLLVFFLAGTVRALSGPNTVLPEEKRRIVALLVLVLLNYTLLFVPSIIWSLAEKAREDDTFVELSFVIVQFSPLADAFLYVLLRKGTVDKVLVSLCCCRMESDDVSGSRSHQ